MLSLKDCLYILNFHAVFTKKTKNILANYDK